MSGFTAADIPDLTARTVIVTGASSGIGLETAKALTRVGAHVVLAVRDEAKGRAAADTLPAPGKKEVRPLDLAAPRPRAPAPRPRATPRSAGASGRSRNLSPASASRKFNRTTADPERVHAPPPRLHLTEGAGRQSGHDPALRE
jgi:NAD(P)-dependent dehydrogenase (short-subunit alcohol dehydrogenase family)